MKNDSGLEANTGKLTWHDAGELTIEGKGWEDTESPYDRLPAKARGAVREPVWLLSRCPAGISIRFSTDAPSLSVKWDGFSAMNHMPATGASGVDLYAVHGGRLKWLAVGRPERELNESLLFEGISAEPRDYVLYLPLYNPVKRVELGIPAPFFLRASPPRDQKAIVFYGTSITQGGCASRPGMCYPSILGRRLDNPVINLGFSGNGLMEPEVIGLLAELSPAVFVLDNMPNMTAELIGRREESAIRKLREAHPETPVVIVDSMLYCDAFLKKARFDRCVSSNRAQRAVYEKLAGEGMKNLHHVRDGGLIGEDGEATVDGTHFTDLGFMRFSEKLFPVLEKLTRGSLAG